MRAEFSKTLFLVLAAMWFTNGVRSLVRYAQTDKPFDLAAVFGAALCAVLFFERFRNYR